MLRLVLLAGAAALVPLPALALSNAATYLLAQEVASACDGASGRYDPTSVVERDLDGDGRADLLIAHEGIVCDGTGRSNECGMMLCSFKIWLRRGELLTPAVDDLLGVKVVVGDGPTPEIRWLAHDGEPFSMRWNGSRFR